MCRLSRFARRVTRYDALSRELFAAPVGKAAIFRFAFFYANGAQTTTFRETRGSGKARVTFRNSRESRLSMRSENTASRRVVVVVAVAADCDSRELTFDPVSNYLRKSLKSHRDAGDLRADKCFPLVHVAASIARRSRDWFGVCSATGNCCCCN